MMTVAEYESKLLNMDKPEVLDELVQECEGPLLLRNTAVARVYIQRLVTSVKMQ